MIWVRPVLKLFLYFKNNRRSVSPWAVLGAHGLADSCCELETPLASFQTGAEPFLRSGRRKQKEGRRQGQMVLGWTTDTHVLGDGPELDH